MRPGRPNPHGESLVEIVYPFDIFVVLCEWGGFSRSHFDDVDPVVVDIRAKHERSVGTPTCSFFVSDADSLPTSQRVLLEGSKIQMFALLDMRHRFNGTNRSPVTIGWSNQWSTLGPTGKVAHVTIHLAR